MHVDIVFSQLHGLLQDSRRSSAHLISCPACFLSPGTGSTAQITRWIFGNIEKATTVFLPTEEAYLQLSRRGFIDRLIAVEFNTMFEHALERPDSVVFLSWSWLTSHGFLDFPDATSYSVGLAG